MAPAAGMEGQGGADSGEAPTYRGSCFCGKVKVDIKGPVALTYNCHCTRCQRLHGAPFASFVNFAAGSITPTPESKDYLACFKSSEKFIRYHCKVCASHVYNDIPVEGYECVDMPVANLERGPDEKVLTWDAVKPLNHAFYPNRADDVSDELPKYDRHLPGFEDFDSGKLYQPSS